MADVGLDADLILDIRTALEQTRRIERALDAATTGISVVVTADTSQVTGAVTTAIDTADSVVVVTGEAAGLTGDVTAAVDNADTDVVVTGDASPLTGEVTSSVDAADTTVVVTGEADGITAAVDGAVDAADTTVVVDADPGPLNRVAAASDDVSSGLADAAGQAGLLRGSIAGLGAAAAVAGLVSLVNAASELEQSIGGSTAIFGEYAGQVGTFAKGASEAAGLTEESARTLTSQIGGLLQGFGFTQDEAAKTSISLAQLGADLAATFGGSPEEAVMALGGALRGEFDPLERFGISLNVTQANLKAVEMGLADNANAVDPLAKAQASLALIMERSAQAQGQFGREVNTTAGQVERARAELGNTAATIGATLQPAVNELIAQFRSDLIPALGELGTQMGPTLVKLITALLPAFGTFSTILISLTPLLEAVASTVEAIPGPVLSVIGTFLAMRAAAGPLGGVITSLVTSLGNIAVPAGAVSGAFSGATAGAGGLLSAINPLTAALAVGAVGFTLWSANQAEARQEAAELAAQSDKLGEALQSTEGVLEGVSEQLVQMARDGDDVVTTWDKLGQVDLPLTEVLQELGLTAQEAADLIAEGEVAVRDFATATSDGSNESEAAAAALSTMSTQYQEQAQAALDAGVATDAWTDRQARAAVEATKAEYGSLNYVAALAQLRDAEMEAAEQAEVQADALSEAEQAMADLAIEAPRVTFALAGLQSEGGRTVSTLAAFAGAADEAGVSGADLDLIAQSLGGSTGPALQANLSAVADTIAEVRDAGASALPSLQDMAGEFEDFSLSGFRDSLADGLQAIRDFNINLALIASDGGPRLAAVAAELGPQYAQGIADGIRDGNPAVVAETEALLGQIESAGTETDALLTNTIGPNLAVATGQMGALATTAFGDSFTIDPSGAIVQTETALTNAGPGVATRAAELGAAGATGVEQGFTPDVTPAIRAAEGAVAAESPNFFTSLFGLGAAGATGVETGFTPDVTPSIRAAEGAATAQVPNFFTTLFGLGAAGATGVEAGFKPTVTPSIRSVEGQADAAKPGFLQRFLNLGQSGTSGFGSGFKPDPNPGITAARNAVDNAQGLSRNAGNRLGTATVQGYQQSTAAMAGAGYRAGSQAASGAYGSMGAARSAGYSVGSALGGGIAAGIASWTGAIAQRARSAVANAAAAARAEAAIASPSKVFATIGGQMGEGMAVGLDRAASDVSAAASSLAAVAAGAAGGTLAPLSASVSSPVPVVTPTAAIAAQAFSGAAAGTVVYVQPGAVQVNIPPGMSVDAGMIEQAAARGIDSVLAQRQVRAVARGY